MARYRMARAPSINSALDPASDQHSIELSLRSSKISAPELAHTKRRFQDAAQRLDALRPLGQLPVVSESSGSSSRYPESRSEPHRPRDAAIHTPSGPDGSHINETTSLLRRTNSTSSDTPYYKHESPWVRYPAVFLEICRIIFLSNWANLFLLFIPLGYAGRALGWPPEAVLVLNGLAMLPLTQLVAMGAEELGVALGHAVAGLLNYSFANAGTIIISCILLQRGEVLVVQTSLLGAIVFNLLVVMGCQYVAGGLKYAEQAFNTTMAQVNSSVLILSIGNITIPAILKQVQGEESVMIVSRQLAVCSILIYLALLGFQFKTHYYLFEEVDYDSADNISNRLEMSGASLAPFAAIILLGSSTVALTVATQFFVDTLNDVTARHGISRTFIGFIFLPMVSNALSHFTEIGDAWRNKLDKASKVAIGCTIQIALFIIPVSVLVGWAIGKDMTLNFDVFLNASAFIAILLLNSVMQNGKSNIVEGVLLLNCYLGIAVGAFFYPAGAGDGEGR